MNRDLNKLTAVVAMLLLAFAFAGCSDDDDPAGPGQPIDATKVVTTAGDAYFETYMIDSDGDGQRDMGVNITADGAVARLADFYIIDYRNSTDYANAHIPGANNLSLGSLVDEIDNLPKDKIILNVCYTGQTASFATSVINLLGTQTGHKAINLKYGMSEWAPPRLVKADESFSYPTSDAHADKFVTTAYDKGAATELPAFDVVATTELAALKERAVYSISRFLDGSAKVMPDALMGELDNWYVVNYFSPEAYAKGHLPSSMQYSKSDLLSGGNLATLPTNNTVAFYCYTGQTSAQVAAYLGMLGYDVKSVMFGVQNMCYGNTTINTVQWHPAPEDTYPLEGTGVN
jgi:rhodanese-related sulfurtransferase